MQTLDNYPVLKALFDTSAVWRQTLNEKDPDYVETAALREAAQLKEITGYPADECGFLFKGLDLYLAQAEGNSSFAVGFWLGTTLAQELETLGRTGGYTLPQENQS